MKAHMGPYGSYDKKSYTIKIYPITVVTLAMMMIRMIMTRRSVLSGGGGTIVIFDKT